MARYEPQNLLAYRVNGDTLDAFGMKYNQALLRIFQFLNDEREHRTTGTETVEPQPGQLKVEDEKLYIRDSANESWVLLGKIASHLGLTPSDVGAVANTGKLGAFKGGTYADLPATASEGDFYWCTDKQAVYYYTESKWTPFLTLDVTKLQNYDLLVKQEETATRGGTAGKIARTNANGVLDFDVSGNAGKLAGVNVTVNHITDGQVLTYRAASNTFTNEDKGVVGSGKSLIIKDGDTQLVDYAGDVLTELDIGRTEHDESLTAHANLLASIFRQPSTAYAVGDVVYVKGAGAKYRLACVTAGTTSADELSAASIRGGAIVTDGTTQWIVDDTTDATPVGMVRASLYLPSGYVLANGATVNRADYPRLVALADAQSLWTDDTAANLGLYGKGDGTTTMVLPNWVGRMAQFADTAGGTMAAGLPNIEGMADGFKRQRNGTHATGALSNTVNYVDQNYQSTTSAIETGRILFDASLFNSIYGASETVQPPAINVLPVLRY